MSYVILVHAYNATRTSSLGSSSTFLPLHGKSRAHPLALLDVETFPRAHHHPHLLRRKDHVVSLHSGNVLRDSTLLLDVPGSRVYLVGDRPCGCASSGIQQNAKLRPLVEDELSFASVGVRACGSNGMAIMRGRPAARLGRGSIFLRVSSVVKTAFFLERPNVVVTSR